MCPPHYIFPIYLPILQSPTFNTTTQMSAPLHQPDNQNYMPTKSCPTPLTYAYVAFP